MGSVKGMQTRLYGEATHFDMPQLLKKIEKARNVENTSNLPLKNHISQISCGSNSYCTDSGDATTGMVKPSKRKKHKEKKKQRKEKKEKHEHKKDK